MATSDGGLSPTDSAAEEPEVLRVSGVLDDVQQTWATILPKYGTPYQDATRSEITAPARPPSVPAAAIFPNSRFAARGSNRSLAISQNPEPRIGTTAETWR